jgi:peptidoglycan/xylan/chitin deacetylase (PgdA/CDA1 family)
MTKLALLAALLVLLPCAVHDARAAVSLPEDKYSAVILAYHRVGEEAYPDTNLRIAQFQEHIQEITSGDYTVLPLGTIMEAIKNHRELPPRALAITFEGAYESAMQNAIPLLLEKNLPFTIFYSSGQLDSGNEQFMSWEELKFAANKNGVDLGVLPASYSRLADQPRDEIRRQVNKAVQRHREVFGVQPRWFAYPFGDYSLAYKKIIQATGFQAAFGLHSGTVFESSDYFSLPRFAMTERYGSLERFRLVVNALPLPAIDLEPQDPYLTGERPSIGFSLPAALEREIGDLSCFISGQPQPEMEIIGRRVEIRPLQIPDQIPDDARLRLNCTMPGPVDTETDMEQWRWIGMFLTAKNIVPVAGGDEPSPPPDGPQ